MRNWALPLGAFLLAGTAACNAPAASGAAASCAAVTPASARGAAHWFGPCVGNRADGLGVLRVGTAAPFTFFAGRMQAGKPGPGLIVHREGTFEPAAGFDARGRTVETDSLHPEQQDRVFALAVQAARATADRFARAGNRGSAAYYRRLAQQIADGQPE